jgi:cytoskeletal protein RodZ
MAGFGETLRQARAHKGVTLREAEQSTRINRHHLAALEEENFDALPPLIYQRGIVRNYATWLGLDGSKMLGMFEEAHGITATGSRAGVTPPPIDMPSHWAPNFAIIGFAVVLSAIVFAWGYSIMVTPDNDPVDSTVVTSATTPQSADVQLATQMPDAPAPPTVPPTVPPEPTATTQESGEVSGRQDSGQPQYVTGLAIEAKNEVRITIVVDGEMMFDQVLGAGQVTDQYVGSLFEITTSANEDTVFINACGDKSQVPDVTGEATFEFPANEGSCKPQ